MSGSRAELEAGLRFAIVCGLLGFSGAAIADEPEVPDLAFLEYLGSWESSDEDWVLFSAEEIEGTTSESEAPTESETNQKDPAPQEKKVAEVEDEY